MTRKGYVGEYRIKNLLAQQYPEADIVKVAISQQGADFIVIEKGRLVKVVEVKETTAKKYYPHPKEKEQIERIKEFARRHGIPAELVVVYRRGRVRRVEVDVKPL